MSIKTLPHTPKIPESSLPCVSIQYITVAVPENHVSKSKTVCARELLWALLGKHGSPGFALKQFFFKKKKIMNMNYGWGVAVANAVNALALVV